MRSSVRCCAPAGTPSSGTWQRIHSCSRTTSTTGSFGASASAPRLAARLYLLGGVAGYVVTPLIALGVFFLIPAFYGITSHGLAELHDAVRRRTLVRRRHPGALP